MSSRENQEILRIENLTKTYPIYGGLFLSQVATVFAATDVSFSLKKGETLGLVGESGCGKSTIGRTLLKLYEPTSGKIFFDGQDITDFSERQMRSVRKEIQVIFQDPFESLNSRHTVGKILREPFEIHKIGTQEERTQWVSELLKKVGLPENAKDRYPHEFSGGQRQRIGIARAIALKPKLVVCDEPVSALDVSIQSQIINLLLELQKEMGISFLFIAHDLSVVKHVSDQVAVMYLGRIVEKTSSERIYKKPLHPYTKSLLSAIPHPDPTLHNKREILAGEVPSPRNPPSGCLFHTRCKYAKDRCKSELPSFREIEPGHSVACHFAEELSK
jgi:peptide/nickel transport system ATP-binding protein